MKVNTNPVVISFEISNWQKRNANKAQGQRDESEVPQSSEISPTPESDTESTRGIVRLLQEGHFKGVADVRLRINFFEELKETEKEQIQTAAAKKVDDVVESVRSNVEPLVQSGELTEEQYDSLLKAFEQGANQVRGEFFSFETPFEEGLAVGLETAFETLATTLSEFLTPAEEPQEHLDDTAEATTESDGVVEIIANLRSAFHVALDGLLAVINDFNVLPPISEPNGNGVAYDKFLVIYNELGNTEPANDEPSETDSLDMLA